MNGATTVKVFTVGLLGALSAIAGGFAYVHTGEITSAALAVLLILTTFYFGWTTADLIRQLEK